MVNRVTPELDHPFLIQRRKEEQGHIQELNEKLKIPVTTMDLFDGEIQGLERLRAYGELLYGDVSELGVHLGPYEVGDRLNHTVHRGMAWCISFPQRCNNTPPLVY